MNKPDFISLYEAFDYLEDELFVYELDELYFHYKGFCINTVTEKRVYVDGYAPIGDVDVQYFWRTRHDGGDFFTNKISMEYGKIDGEEISDSLSILGGVDLSLSGNHMVNDGNVYVNKSCLDEFHNRLGIPYKSSAHVQLDDSDNTSHAVLNPKSEKTYLNIIGVLLDYIK